MPLRENKPKYRLKELAELLIRTSYVSERDFIKELNIPWSTYQKDKQALLTQAFSMPEERMQRYARGFDVPLSSILNYRVNQKAIVINFSAEEQLERQFGIQ